MWSVTTGHPSHLDKVCGIYVERSCVGRRGGDYSVPIFFSVYMLKRSRGLHLGVGGTGH